MSNEIMTKPVMIVRMNGKRMKEHHGEMDLMRLKRIQR
jgi:hypothetical protein